MKLDNVVAKLESQDKYHILTYKKGKIRIEGNPPYSFTWTLSTEKVKSPLDSYKPNPLDNLATNRTYDCILAFQDEYIAGQVHQFLKKIVIPIQQREITFHKMK